MDFRKLKQYIILMLEIIDLSKSRYASFRIVWQDDGQYNASLLLNSDDTFKSGRQKSQASKQRDVQRKKDFLSKKSAINPCRQSPAPGSHREPRKVDTENADNTSQSSKISIASAGEDHPELPDVHPNLEEPLTVVEAERRKTYP